jgi:hypothetical protein
MAAIDLIVKSRVIYEDLRNLGCCERCCLRYVGGKNPESYRCVKAALVKVQWLSCLLHGVVHGTSPNLKFVFLACFLSQIGLENEKDFDSGPEQKMRKCNPCILCLGLLQEEFFTDETVQQVILYAVVK